MKKKFLFHAFAAIMMSICSFGFTSCDNDDEPNGNALKFSPEKVEVAPNKSITVSINGGTAPFTVTSSDTKIATASVSGTTITVAGVKNGNTIINVVDKNKFTGKFNVKVTDKPVTGLSLDKIAVNVGVKKTETVTVSNGSVPYTATSKDTKIATVSVNDNKISIAGVKAGKTTVTITDKNKKSATVNVTVK